MSRKFTIGALRASLFAAVLLTFSPVQAKDNTAIEVSNLRSGQLVFIGEPVQIQGKASDPEGIREIYGTIQDVRTQLFFTPKGKFAKKPVRLPFHLTNRSGDMLWTTNKLRVPEGDYIYRMRVEDNGKNRSRIVELGMVVRSENQSNAVASSANSKSQRQRRQQQQLQQQQAQQRQQPQQQAQVAAKPAAQSAGAMAANGMPYCSNAGFDPDNDGYGWENEKSCVVAGSRADKHPNCASAASDPDGDGWGWENERSCVVVTQCQNANSDPDGDGWGWENDKSCVVVKTAGRHPQCQSAASDPDGDGYGWENNATCLVAK